MPFEDIKKMLEAQDEDARIPIEVVKRHDEEFPNGAIEINNSVRLTKLPVDRIMVLEDKFKSSYECQECKGSGKVKKTCLKCEGHGSYLTAEGHEACGKCDAQGTLEGECSTCKGIGHIVVIPEQHKTRPTSGVIVAIGPDVKFWEIGDRVVFTGYTGHLVPFKGNTRIRVMTEKEPLCMAQSIAGGDEGMEVKFIDKDNAYDVE